MKTLGYYCGAFPNDEGLLNDMTESWGSRFEALNNAQRLWMVRAIADTLFEQHPLSDEDADNDEEVSEAMERLTELNRGDMLGLLEAIVAQLKHYDN